MATSYFRERARNPYLQRTPGFEDDPNISPTFSRPMPMAPEVIEAPARAIAPTVAPSPFEVIEKEREAYAAGAPTTTKGKILQALAGAGLGFLRGAASNREDPLGAGIGGAAAGGVISAVSPGAGRSMQFEMVKRPQIEERLRGEEDKRKRTLEAEDRARSISMDDLKRREGETRIKGLEAETRARRFETVPAGSDLVDTATGQPIYQGQPRAAAPTRDELTIEPSSGKSFEQIARDSYEARGGDAYVLSRLPAWMQQVINKGTMMTQDKTGKITEAPASPEEIQMAQRALSEAIDRQWKADVEYTRGDVRSRALGARKGAPQQPKAPQSGTARPRSQFNSNKFPGLKFE